MPRKPSQLITTTYVYARKTDAEYVLLTVPVETELGDVPKKLMRCNFVGTMDYVLQMAIKNFPGTQLDLSASLGVHPTVFNNTKIKKANTAIPTSFTHQNMQIILTFALM